MHPYTHLSTTCHCSVSCLISTSNVCVCVFVLTDLVCSGRGAITGGGSASSSSSSSDTVAMAGVSDTTLEFYVVQQVQKGQKVKHIIIHTEAKCEEAHHYSNCPTSTVQNVLNPSAFHHHFFTLCISLISLPFSCGPLIIAVFV